MRLPPLPPRRLREPVGPLVDIVFLLLVFFLLAGTLEPTAPMVVTPPTSPRAAAQTDAPLHVLLGADGRLALEGRLLTLTELSSVVAERLRDGEHAVQIEADGRVGSGQLMALVEALRDAGALGLTLVATPGEATGGQGG